MQLREKEFKRVDWIQLAEDMVQWQDSVNTNSEAIVSLTMTFVSQMSRKFWSLYFSQPYDPPWPVTWIALHSFFTFVVRVLSVSF